MTAFTAKVATLLDAGKKVRTDWLNALWDNTQWLKDLLASHVHDGIDSAKIPIGPNYLRNGSFENDTSGWTLTNYTGGTVQRVSAVTIEGNSALAFSSGTLGAGGGSAVSDEYLPVTEYKSYSVGAFVKASVAGLSFSLGILWYDKDKILISSSTISSDTLPTTLQFLVGDYVFSPNGARFMRIKFIGCVPGVGSATGTVYANGFKCPIDEIGYMPGTINFRNETHETNVTGASISKYSESVVQANMYVQTTLTGFVNTGGTLTMRIYKNGSAYGTNRTTSSTTPVTFTENLFFAKGDLMQMYAGKSGGGSADAQLTLQRLEADVSTFVTNL